MARKTDPKTLPPLNKAQTDHLRARIRDAFAAREDQLRREKRAQAEKLEEEIEQLEAKHYEKIDKPLKDLQALKRKVEEEVLFGDPRRALAAVEKLEKEAGIALLPPLP